MGLKYPRGTGTIYQQGGLICEISPPAFLLYAYAQILFTSIFRVCQLEFFVNTPDIILCRAFDAFDRRLCTNIICRGGYSDVGVSVISLTAFAFDLKAQLHAAVSIFVEF